MDFSDEKKVKERNQRIKNAEDARNEDLIAMLETPQGRRFLWGELSAAGIFTISFTGNSTTFYNEGRRSHGLRLLTELITASEENTLQMFSENLKAELATEESNGN